MRGPCLPASASSRSLLEDPTRLQEVFASFRPSATIHEDGADETGDNASLTVEELEKQLHVSAQLGLALLERQEQLASDKKALQTKQRELEASISQLLDRLASSYKENAQLIKRAERAQANLDASEASNRQLLITLEDDRKTIRRLTAAQARNGTRAIGGSLEMDELRQELASERRRADVAEGRALQATRKLSANQSRLASVSQQLDRLQAERHQRLSSSSLIRASSSQDASVSQTSQDDYEALAVRYKADSEAMQADIRQLQELLQDSQDQISHLQTRHFEDDAIGLAESAGEDTPGNLSLARELPMSPNADGSTGRDWSSSYQHANVMGRLPHASNESTGSASSVSSRMGPRRRSQQRTVPSSSLRRMGGRAMSVDLSGMMQRKLEDLEYDYQNRATPPGGRSPISPQLKPFALAASVNSLSSSLGPPAFPSGQYDIEEAEEAAPEPPTILEISPSPIKPPFQGESGLSKTSPTKQRRDTISAKHAPLLIAAKDVSVQTVTVAAPSSLPSYSSSKPSYSQYTPSIMSSDAMSEHGSLDHIASLNHGQSSETLRSGGSRMAALASLMDHVAKLLARLKSADIVSLEARLKKQNLPGDVGHLAKSTMRDILSEIDNLRVQFRQVLDREIAAARQESESQPSELSSESLLARKDFVLLVKLFRDILYELGRLRVMVNRVGLEPQLAGRLREIETVQSPTELLTSSLASAQADKSTAASLLAPLSRLWNYGTEPQQGPSAMPELKAAPNHKSAARAAPKLTASSAVATATVNVEFGGQGGIRRQVSIMPQEGVGGLSARYHGGLGVSTGAPKSRQGMNRQISSIFAGGAAGGHSQRQSAAGHAGVVRNRQSRYQLLSQNVDAVIDNPTNGEDEQDLRPNLLERTLRPRGLSDSSIHSTFISHASPANRLLTPAGLALSSTSPTNLLPDELEATLRATSPAPRPSVLRPDGALRKISASMKSYTSFGAKDSLAPEAPDPSHGNLSAAATRSPGKGAKTAGPVALVRPSGSASQISGSPASNSGGLLAGIGAWASRAASYQEPSHLGQRSTSASSRKALIREAEI